MTTLPEPLSKAWHERQDRNARRIEAQMNRPILGERPPILATAHILALIKLRGDLLLLALKAPAQIEILVHLAQLNLATAICIAVATNPDPAIELADHIPQAAIRAKDLTVTNKTLQIIRDARTLIARTSAIAPVDVAKQLERCLPWLDCTIRVGEHHQEILDQKLVEATEGNKAN